MMEFKISLYGKLSDTLGHELSFELRPGACTVAELRHHLAERYPAAAEDLLSPRVRACVNDAIVEDSNVIQSGDAIGLLPPVSGG